MLSSTPFSADYTQREVAVGRRLNSSIHSSSSSKAVTVHQCHRRYAFFVRTSLPHSPLPFFPSFGRCGRSELHRCGRLAPPTATSPWERRHLWYRL
jgi:hypothetical protein